MLGVGSAAKGGAFNLMNRIAFFLLLSCVATAGQTGEEVKRPRILGISHMALFLSDLQKSR